MSLSDQPLCKRMRVNGNKRCCPDTLSTAPKCSRAAESVDAAQSSHRDALIHSTSCSVCKTVMPSMSAESSVQVFIKNLTGQSVGVYVHLDQDVQELARVFAQREGLLDTRLRFVYGGKQLEIGRPLWGYGIRKGSNIHLTAILKSKCFQASLALKVITPFAEASGVLTVWHSARTADRSPCCHLYPEMARCLSPDHTPSRWSASGNFLGQSLEIVLHEFRPFTCIIHHDVDDMWHRMRSLPARLLMRTKVQGCWDVEQVENGRPLLLPLYNTDQLHISISLLTEQEWVADDVMERFVEVACPGEQQEECCICLEPMLPCQMLRRLPCFHRLHAGCAMVPGGILQSQRCPLCRCSLFAM